MAVGSSSALRITAFTGSTRFTPMVATSGGFFASRALGPDSSTGVRDQTTLMTRTMTRRSTTRSRLLAPIWTATKDHTDLSESLLHVASCLKTLGRDTEALPKFEAAYEMLQRSYKGRDQPDAA